MNMAENWIALADADVLAPDSGERAAVAAVKRRDDLADIVGQVIGQVRQAYTFGNRDLGDEGTIPEGLKARAVAIALWRFVSEGMPKNPVMQTAQREAAYKEATDYLEKIANADVGRVSSPSVQCKPHRFGMCDQDGI